MNHVVFYPISLRFRTNDLDMFLLNLFKELSILCDEDWTLLEQAPRSQLALEVQRMLGTPLADGMQVVVVVDGLDEIANVEDIPTIFPTSLGLGWRLLITVRGEPRQDARVWLKRLGWTDIRTTLLSVGNLNRQEMHDGVKKSGLHIEASIEEHLLDHLDYLTEKGDPVLFNLYLHELLSAAQEDRVSSLTLHQLERMNLSNREPGLNAYLEGIGKQLSLSEVYADDLFKALSIARGPLEERDLRALGVLDKDSTSLSPGLLSRGLIVGDFTSGLSFSHQKIADTYRQNHLLFSEEHQHEWLERFRQYGFQQQQALKSGCLSPSNASPYLLQYHVSHVLDPIVPGNSRNAYAILEKSWIEAHEAVLHTYEYFLTDVDRVWEHALRESATVLKNGDKASDMDVLFKSTLCLSSFVALADQLPSHLPALLVQDDIWSARQSLTYVFRISDALQRVRALMAFLQNQKTRSRLTERELHTINRSILNAVGTIIPNTEDVDSVTSNTHHEFSEDIRYQILIDLIPHLNHLTLYKRAYTIGRSLTEPTYRIRVLLHVLPHLPYESQLTTLVEIIELAANSYNPIWADSWHNIYVDFVRHIPGGKQLHEAFRIIDEKIATSSQNQRNSYEVQDRYSPGPSDIKALLNRLAPYFRTRLSDDFLSLCIGRRDNQPCIPAIVIQLATSISPAAAQLALGHMFPPWEEIAASEGYNYHRYGKWQLSHPFASDTSFLFCKDELVAAMILDKGVKDPLLNQRINKIVDDHLDSAQLTENASVNVRTGNLADALSRLSSVQNRLNLFRKL